MRKATIAAVALTVPAILAGLTGCSDKPSTEQSSADTAETTNPVTTNEVTTSPVTTNEVTTSPVTTTTGTPTSPATTTTGTPTSPATTTSETAPNPGAAGAGITANGQDIPVNGAIRCSTDYTGFVIAAGEDYGSARVKLDSETPTRVYAVSITDLTGAEFAFGTGLNGGDAAVTKSGNTYTVTGNIPFDGLPPSPAPAVGPGAAEGVTRGTIMPFEIEVTCP